jgi:sortase (surface protein transpeptidase)
MKGAEAAGAHLSHPSSVCSTNPGSVTFGWTPLAGNESQLLQVSLEDNGFAADTFTEVSLSSDAETYTMSALDRTAPIFWRIVAETGSGEVASATKAFVACGGPVLLYSPMECRSYTTAAVRFNWAPAANYQGEQWLEFDSNEDWTGDDFWQVGPYSPALGTLRRSNFVTDTTYSYRVVLEVGGERQVSDVGSFTPDCYPSVNPENYATDDRLVIPAISVDAPVNIRDVGVDGLLGVPTGGYDVVKYNFSYFPQLQGVIGGPGPTMVAGHFDYHVIGPAVFWDLALLKQNDVLEYWDGDVKFTYVVQWVAAVPYSEPLNAYLQGSDDALILITCFGTFDRSQFGGYDQRTIVYATPQ